MDEMIAFLFSPARIQLSAAPLGFDQPAMFLFKGEPVKGPLGFSALSHSSAPPNSDNGPGIATHSRQTSRRRQMSLRVAEFRSTSRCATAGKANATALAGIRAWIAKGSRACLTGYS